MTLSTNTKRGYAWKAKALWLKRGQKAWGQYGPFERDADEVMPKQTWKHVCFSSFI